MCLMKKVYKNKSLRGEIRGVCSELLLKRDPVTAAGVQSELTNVLELFVFVSVVQNVYSNQVAMTFVARKW